MSHEPEAVDPDAAAWAKRMARFFETHDFDGITQSDLDLLHEHWSRELRLHVLTDRMAN